MGYSDSEEEEEEKPQVSLINVETKIKTDSKNLKNIIENPKNPQRNYIHKEHKYSSYIDNIMKKVIEEAKRWHIKVVLHSTTTKVMREETTNCIVPILLIQIRLFSLKLEESRKENIKMSKLFI